MLPERELRLREDLVQLGQLLLVVLVLGDPTFCFRGPCADLRDEIGDGTTQGRAIEHRDAGAGVARRECAGKGNGGQERGFACFTARVVGLHEAPPVWFLGLIASGYSVNLNAICIQ